MDNIQLEKYPEKMRELLSRYFNPRENENPSPILKLEASHAIECMVTIACMFKALETCNFNLVCNSFINLLWGLERNQFWKQYSTELLPILRVGFSSYLVALKLIQQPDQTEEIKVIVVRNAKAWLQIFPTGLGCLYGHNRMIDDSNALLIELEKIT